MHGIYELKEMLCKELEEYGSKGELSAGTLDIVDKLAHAVKNLDKIIMSYEESEGEYSSRGSYYDGGMSGEGSYAGGGRGGNRGGGSSNRSSYARRRDSMGRYSRERGYSRADGVEDMVMELRELKEDAPNAQIKRRIDELVAELERA